MLLNRVKGLHVYLWAHVKAGSLVRSLESRRPSNSAWCR